MIRSNPPIASVVLALVATSMLAACADTATTSTTGDAPLPTIGLGSETGELSGSVEARFVGSSSIDTVVMIGDSITVAATPMLEAAFDELGFAESIVEAQQSKRTAVDASGNPAGSTVVDALLAGELADGALADGDHGDELWVVALGTNDINQYADSTDVAAAVNAVLAAVPDGVPLVWVDTYFRDQPDGTERVNTVIEARLADRGDAVVARWSEVAATEGHLRSDGVHPRDVGSQAFADVVRAAIVDVLDLG